MQSQRTVKNLKRKILLIVIVIAVIAALVAGVVWAYRHFSSTEVKVYSISDLNVGDWEDSSSITGMISNSATQEITLDADKTVAKVYVKDGDTVKKGDKLFKYDVTLSELELESDKLNKQSLELKIKTLKSQIANPKKYLKEEYEYGYDESDSMNISDDSSTVMTEKDDGLEDVKQTDGSEDSKSTDSDKSNTSSEDNTVEEEQVIVITQEEVNQYLSEKKSELKETELNLAKSELEITKLEKELKNKVVKSKIDGVVKLGSEGSGTYMTVQSTDGLYIKGSLNEYLVGKVEAGDILNGEDYYTGETFEAEIQTISEFPVESDYQMYEEESSGENVSYYSFTALITDDIEASSGDDVSLSLQTQSSGESLFLEKAFVISENGSSYVYMRDADGKLKKKKVKLGKTVEGSIVEIKSGLTEENFIAFPYGKEVKEGAKTRKAEIDELYE